MKIKKLLQLTLLLSIVTTPNVALADGLLSGLFGSKNDANFKSLLSFVPEDTAYIFANKEPIPDEVMNFHIKRGQEIMALISPLDETSKLDEAEKTQTIDKGSADSFLKALLEEVSTKVNEGKIEETGLSLKASTVLYGFEMKPVMRLSFADKDKIMEAIKRAEKSSEYELKLSKCGDFDCFYPTTKGMGEKETLAIIVILENHLAVSIYGAEDKDKVINHLIGKTLPKTAYSADKWDDFLKENDYNGNGDGYIDLQKLYQNFKPEIVESLQKKSKQPEKFIKELDPCIAVVDAHMANLSEVVFGTKNLKAKNMDYELIIKTSDVVSAALQGIANTTNIKQRLENPVFDLGFNINFVKMRDALMQYSAFLSNSGKQNKCKAIDERKISKSMGGLMLAMNMGLTQLKSLYFGLGDVDLTADAPQKVDAMLSIGTDDPAGLLGMLSMLNPRLMGFQLPKDGSVVELPKGAIPSKGMPLPPIFVSRGEKVLNILVGDKKPNLIEYAKKIPEMMSFSMDGTRYYEVIASIMKSIPKSKYSKGTDEAKQAADAMQKVSKMMGSFQKEITADKRGLVINYHINY